MTLSATDNTARKTRRRSPIKLPISRPAAPRTAYRRDPDEARLYRCQVLFSKDEYDAMASVMGSMKESTFIREGILDYIGYYDQEAETLNPQP